MISLIIKNYDLIFLALIGAAALSLIAILSCFITKSRRAPRSIKNEPSKQAAADHCELACNQSNQSTLSKEWDDPASLVITAAIAGEDKLATQLDLARAYIETGKTQLAKKILLFVLEKGALPQQQEAKRLLGIL